MKINLIELTSFVYFGAYESMVSGKIGMTARILQDRQEELSKKEKFNMFACLLLTNVTQAQRSQVESDMRAALEKVAFNVGNDHFIFPYDWRYNREYNCRLFCVVAMLAAIESCERNGFKYQFSWLR